MNTETRSNHANMVWRPASAAADVVSVGILGGGLIGSGWAAHFLANGFQVKILENTEQSANACLSHVTRALHGLPLSEALDAVLSRLTISLEPEFLAGVNFIQECLPERITLKREVIARLEQIISQSAVIASSTSTLTIAEISQGARHPLRIIAGHPFHPVELIPLVEIAGISPEAAPVLNWAREIYDRSGRVSVILKKEASGMIANRLSRAVWREAVHILTSGIAGARAVDDAMRYGPGLRYAVMGPFETYQLAGGDMGIRGYFEQFGGGIERSWADLGAPDYDEAMRDYIIAAVESAYNEPISAREDRRNQALKALTQTAIEGGQTCTKPSEKNVA